MLQSGIYIYFVTNISEGMTFLLQGLKYRWLGQAKTLQFKMKDSMKYETIKHVELNEEKVNFENLGKQKRLKEM